MHTYNAVKAYLQAYMYAVPTHRPTYRIIAKTMHSHYLPYMLNKFIKIRGGQMPQQNDVSALITTNKFICRKTLFFLSH